MNLAACPNRFRHACLCSSITARGPSRKHPPTYAPTPRNNWTQIRQPAPVTQIRDPRPTIRGSRSVDHGPMCLGLGSGKISINRFTTGQAQAKIDKRMIKTYHAKYFSHDTTALTFHIQIQYFVGAKIRCVKKCATVIRCGCARPPLPAF